MAICSPSKNFHGPVEEMLKSVCRIAKGEGGEGGEGRVEASAQVQNRNLPEGNGDVPYMAPSK